MVASAVHLTLQATAVDTISLPPGGNGLKAVHADSGLRAVYVCWNILSSGSCLIKIS